MKKKNILLTGASGTVGFEVLKQLVNLDLYNVTILDKETKNSRKKLIPFQDKIKLIFADITNTKELETIKAIDFVIHLAAIIPPVADDLPDLAHQVNFVGTQNLISQLENYSPGAFIIFSSSISVYGDRILNPLINVGDPLLPSPNDYYAVTKIAAEECIKKSKLDYTIFRLAAIMGNHKISKLMFHQPLNTALEIATPQDTARAFVNAIENKNGLSKQIFNLGGGENCRVSYKNFLEISFSIFGLGKLDFPKYTFAEKNFHCGYYADGAILENIISFRKDSLNDYFKMEAKKVSFAKKLITSVFKKIIKWFLLKKSEPYRAYKNKDTVQINRYFN